MLDEIPEMSVSAPTLREWLQEDLDIESLVKEHMGHLELTVMPYWDEDVIARWRMGGLWGEWVLQSLMAQLCVYGRIPSGHYTISNPIM